MHNVPLLVGWLLLDVLGGMLHSFNLDYACAEVRNIASSPAGRSGDAGTYQA